MPKKAKNNPKLSRFAEPNGNNIDRAFDFPKFYATNVYGALTPEDFRIQFLNEKEEFEDGWYYIADGMAILSPKAAKRLNKFLEEGIKSYEAQHGVIDTKATSEQPY